MTFESWKLFLLLKLTFCGITSILVSHMPSWCCCSTRFGENVLKDPGQVDIFPSSKIPKGIRHMVQPIPYGGRGLGRVRQKLGDVKGSGRGVRVITEPGVLSAILKWVPDVEVKFPSLSFSMLLLWFSSSPSLCVMGHT